MDAHVLTALLFWAVQRVTTFGAVPHQISHRAPAQFDQRTSTNRFILLH